MYSGILVPEYGQEKIYGVLDHLELVDSHKVPWSHNLPLTEHGEVMLPPGTGAVPPSRDSTICECYQLSEGLCKEVC